MRCFGSRLQSLFSNFPKNFDLKKSVERSAVAMNAVAM